MNQIITIDNLTKVENNKRQDQLEHNNLFDTSFYASKIFVEPVPLFSITKNGQQDLENYFGLYNLNNESLLQTRPISKTYKIVQHHLIFNDNANSIDKAFPNAKVKVVDRFFEHGLKAHREITFLDEQFSKVIEGESVQAKIDIFNSLDMSWPFQYFSGAYRSACQNTCVFGGQKAFHIRKKHTSNLDTKALTNIGSVNLQTFINQFELMDRMQKTKIDKISLGNTLKNTLCFKKNNRMNDNVDSIDNYNKGLYDQIFSNFESIYQNEMGSTLWAFYNALTHWSSHETKTRKNASWHNTKLDRESRVRQVINSKYWNQLLNNEEVVFSV